MIPDDEKPEYTFFIDDDYEMTEAIDIGDFLISGAAILNEENDCEFAHPSNDLKPIEFKLAGKHVTKVFRKFVRRDRIYAFLVNLMFKAYCRSKNLKIKSWCQRMLYSLVKGVK